MPRNGTRSAPHSSISIRCGSRCVNVATDLEASRLLYRQAAERLGMPDGAVAVAHAKRFCPDAALRAAVACIEVRGTYG